MLFVPRDVAKKAIQDQLEEIKKRDAERSAEWRRNFHETYKDYIIDENK